MRPPTPEPSLYTPLWVAIGMCALSMTIGHVAGGDKSGPSYWNNPFFSLDQCFYFWLIAVSVWLLLRQGWANRKRPGYQPSQPAKLWQNRYARVRVAIGVIMLVILIVLTATMVAPGPPFRINANWAIGLALCFSVYWGMGLFFRRQARLERQSLGNRSGQPPAPGNPIFWQAILILLPVMALTVLGLFYLQQDRSLAEQEARDRAGITADRLAQAFGQEASRQLHDYRNANFELKCTREGDLGWLTWGREANAEEQAWVTVKTWQAANPDLDLSHLPVSDVDICTTPRFNSPYSSPQLYPSAPQPGDWVTKLAPEQRQLWQAVESVEYAANDTSTARLAITNFLKSKPPAGARANAQYHLLRLQTATLPPAEASALWSDSPLGNSEEYTEAGLPIAQLVRYQALHLLPDHAGLPPHQRGSLPWAIYYRPAAFSGRLISEVERVASLTPATPQPDLATRYRWETNQYGARHFNANLEPDVPALRGWWTAEDQARQVISTFLDEYPTNTWTNALFWVAAPNGRFGLMLNQPYAEPPKVFATNGVSTPIRRNGLLFPESLIPKFLAAAVTNAYVTLPPYALTCVEVGGRQYGWRTNQAVTVPSLPVQPILAEATGRFACVLPNTNTYPFHVRLFLADRPALYARQHQRTLLFGGMILASALSALVGLFAAHRAFRRQHELNALKSNFVSSVSHELRAPIASVRLLAENLENGKVPEPEKQRAYFHFIVQECRRLASLIENVLDFSRIEQGRKQYDFESTDLAVLVRQTVTLLEPYAAEKGVFLKLEPAAATALELVADGRALQQALVNLIDNAVKHSPKGAVVTVGLEATPALVSLWVADNGAGIPEVEREKIFERFYRLGSELRRETQGVGIGLSIVKHITEAHGGRVLVQSSLGWGSRFTLELPVRATTTNEH